MSAIQPSVIDRLRIWPASRGASRRPVAWASHELLSTFACAADAAIAARTEPSVLEALASQVDDEIAALAAMSVLAVGLGRIACRWRRAGLVGVELQDAEGHLVLEALDALRAAPAGPADVIVQRAWHRVSARRRTELARRSRCLPLGRIDLPCPGGSTEGWTTGLSVLSGLAKTDRLTVVAAITGAKQSAGKAASGAERTRRWRARRALEARLFEEENESTRKVAV